MTSRVTLQPALVLHTRAFRDTSLLVDVLTLHHGRITVLARGVRSARSKLRGILLPFVPLVISWSGKTDLPTLTAAETTSSGYNLSGKAFLSGFYLNELLTRVLQRADAHPVVFGAYNQALLELQNNIEPELVLRRFEKILLRDIGYGLELDQDSDNKAVNTDDFYIFEFGSRLVKTSLSPQHAINIFPGKSLLAIHRDELHNAHIMRDAKRLLRLVIGNLVGDRPLKSRELFQN